MLNTKLLIPLRPIGLDVKRFIYKTYTICLSDEKPQRVLELPYRVLSIVDHTGRDEATKQDLLDILDYFGLNTNMPITRDTTQARGNPSRGNTQYYMQPLTICTPVKNKMA